MDKPALESGNLRGWSLRREISGENFRLEADSWQGAGPGGEGGGLVLGVVSCSFPIPPEGGPSLL